MPRVGKHSDTAFLARLRTRRERAGLSQGEAARRLGLSRASWAQWESGRRYPGITTVQKIAGVLRCRPADLDPRLSHQIPPILMSQEIIR